MSGDRSYVLYYKMSASNHGKKAHIYLMYLAAEGLEAAVILAVLAAHRVRHLLNEPEGRRHGLGVLAEDKAEIDVEHLARCVDLHQ